MSKAQKTWLFRLVMLGVLVIIFVWRYSNQSDVEKIEASSVPLFTLKKADLKQFNSDGRKVYTLLAEHLDYFGDDKNSYLHKPLLYAFDPKRLDNSISWKVQSEEGFINANHTEVTLKNDVKLQYFDYQTEKETTVLSPHMLILADGTFVSTPERVTILMPPYRSEGIGFTGYPHVGQFSLNQEVKSSYDVNPKKSP